MTAVVVGVGNFGAWWATGLLRSQVGLNVVIHDPNPEAERLVLERANSGSEKNAGKSKLSFAPTVNDLPNQADLVVVATNADVRPLVVQQLSKLINCRTWVLEKVLAQSTSALTSLNESLEGRDVYVNHSRRFQPATAFLAGIFSGRGTPESIKLSGGLWELASNATHFLDLVEYWFPTELVSIDTTGLGQWRPSRTRANGFEDVDGQMNALFRGGTSLVMDWNHPDCSTWEFQFKGNLVTYDEVSGSIRADGEELARVPLANFSDLVPSLMKHWTNTGYFYPLPSLGHASVLHKHLLESLSSNRSTHGETIGHVPIS